MYISCKKQSTNSADVSHVKRVWKIYRVTKFVIRWCFGLFCYFWGKFWVINDEYNSYNFRSCLKGLLIYVLKLSITRWNCPKCLFYLRELLFLCISLQLNILVNSFLIKKPKLWCIQIWSFCEIFCHFGRKSSQNNLVPLFESNTTWIEKDK